MKPRPLSDAEAVDNVIALFQPRRAVKRLPRSDLEKTATVFIGLLCGAAASLFLYFVWFLFWRASYFG